MALNAEGEVINAEGEIVSDAKPAKKKSRWDTAAAPNGAAPATNGDAAAPKRRAVDEGMPLCIRYFVPPL